MQQPALLDLTIVILTFNEERRLADCLDSIDGIAAQVFVVDSYSNDGTLDMLRDRGIPYVQHAFANYSDQRNWAQANNPFGTRWIFHLDADERLTAQCRAWLAEKFANLAGDYAGFMFSRRTVFLGRWIRHGGHYPVFHLRLFQADRGTCEDKTYDQHFVVEGATLRVDGADIVDIVAIDIESFLTSHNKWSSMEAEEIAAGGVGGAVRARLFGNPIERRRWLKRRIFERAPIFVRGAVYFFYRYFIRLGFLDRTEGLIFHFLHAFWFRFMIDAKVYEIRKRREGDVGATR